ncbi:MAG: gamma-glutamyltransferase [Oscillospiraceae bacterium]
MKVRTPARFCALTMALALLVMTVAGCGASSTAPASGAPAPAPVSSAAPASAAPVETPLPEKVPGDEFGNAAVGRKAAVVSANEYTTKIGMDILKAGGNAVDAAVAMIFANSLTEPGATTLAGASFMTIYLKESGEYICIEAMEKAPAAAGIDTLDEINAKKGAMYLTVPGQVHGALTALEKYGTMTREQVLEPVAKLAEEGFNVHISFEERASAAFDKLSANEEAKKVYTNNGLPYALGDHFTNPDYAATIRKIIKGGNDEFYKGSIAKSIVDEVQRLGGILTMEDMANYTSVERKPIKTTYHGYEIVTQGPPSNGGAPMLEMFNILENYDLKKMGFNSPEYLYTFNEALRLAMADGITYFGDPDFYDLPIDTMISKEYAKKRIAENMRTDGKINETLIPGEDLPFKKVVTATPESTSTTHVSVIDEFGNMVATTHTIGGYFGSCIVAPGTGFALNAHLQNQKLDIAEKDNPNFVQGGLRVMSTMCPTLVVHEGEPFMAIGSPGSWCIPPAIVQILNSVLLFDMDLQSAINEPRAIFTNYKSPKKVTAEPRIPEETIKALQEAGYEMNVGRDWNTSLGSVGVIMVDPDDGLIYAGGDNRRQYKSLAY